MNPLLDDFEFLSTPSPIAEIIYADELLFALTKSGLCIAFTRRDLQPLCILNNKDKHELYRSFFYNEEMNALVGITVNSDGRLQTLQCQSITLDAIRQADPLSGTLIYLWKKNYIILVLLN